jgi:drug/metabolite transporter (DMT)-like permease
MGSSSEHQPETRPSGPPAPRPALAWGAWITCSLIWGSTFLFISLGNDTLAPVWAASLRLALAAVLLTGIARLLRHAFPHGRALRAAMAYGFLQFGVNFPLLYWGEKTFPSGLTAVLYATIPLSTALMTAALRMERLTPLKLAGAGVALAGVALLFSDQLGARVGLVPGLVIFAAATFAAWSGVILKRGPRQSPLWTNAVGAAVGLVVCLIVSFALGEAHPFPTRFAAWFPVVYLTLAGSVGAFVLFAWLINHWPVTRVSFIGVVNPVVALLLGWLVRDEHLGWASLGGSALILVGVIFGLRGSAPQRVESPLADRKG